MPAHDRELLDRLGSGTPLPSSLLDHVGRVFERDLSGVRVHANSPAAVELGARAFALRDHVAFAPGLLSYGSTPGRRLLMHELAHVVQQGGGTGGVTHGDARAAAYEAQAHRAGLASVPLSPVSASSATFVQRDAAPPDPVQLMPDVTVTEDPDRHRVVYAFRGKPWITIKYKDRSRELLEFDVKGWSREEVDIKISSKERLRVTIDLDVERELRASRSTIDQAAIVYDFTFPGAITVKDRGLTQRFATPARRLARDYTQRTSTIEGLPNAPTRQHEEAWQVSETKNSYPSFAKISELRKFLDASPQKSFAVVRTKDGHFVARPLSREELRQLARAARANKFDPKGLEDIDWYNNEYASGELEGLWIEGQEYDALADLRDQFFDSPDEAAKDESGSRIECEVYDMGPISSAALGNSYGRKVLSHTEALARMRELDGLTTKQVDLLDTVPGKRFFALNLRGVSSEVHQIASSYFYARDGFRDTLAKLDASGDANNWFVVQQYFHAYDYQNYIALELDRSEDNPELIKQLEAHRTLASVYGELHYSEVVDAGQQWAADSFAKAARELRAFVADDKELAKWVITCPYQGSQKVFWTLRNLDLDDDSAHALNTLTDPSESLIIAAGGEVRGYSLETIRQAAEKVAKKMDDARDSILRRDIIAIKQEGEFGDSVREGVYKQYGYTLDPKSFGLKLSGGDAFGHNALRGDRSSFASLGEQMFATQLRREIAEDNVWHWAKIIGLALATVVLVVGLNAVGGAIAEGIFGFAEGTFGYLATTALITGTGLTAWEVGQAKLAGYDMTWGEILKAEAWNVLTAGLLGKLGFMFKGASAPLRIGIIGSAAFGLGLARFLMEHKGPVTGKELLHFMIENAIMFAAMEAAGVFARSFTTKAALWGRARRLGIEPQALADFQLQLNNLFRDLKAYRVRPADAAGDAASIERQVADLLALQEKIVKDIADKATRFGDSEQVKAELAEEIEAIKAAAEGMKRAHFLAKLKLQPLGDSRSIFTFEPGPTALDDIKSFFPDATVEAQPDGTIKITLPGSEGSVLLVPSTSAAAATPADAPATTKVDINSASEQELATLPGIGKKLAKAIVAARRKLGGFFNSVDDLANVPGIGEGLLSKLLPLIEAQDRASVTGRRQQELTARQKALLDRAARTGHEDPTLDAIGRDKLRPDQSTDPDTLDAAEAKIAAAEKRAGRAMDRAARKALARTLKKLGVNASRLKAGSLANVPDDDIGDALARIAGRQKLTLEALRGVVWAHLKGVNIEKFMDFAQGYGTNVRNRILDTFGRLADAGVTRCEKVLSDMSRSAGAWDGGLFVLDVARFGYGIENVEGFEVRISGEGGDRDIDIVLKNGLRLELKNWRDLKHIGDLADASNKKDPGQFLVDCANGGFDPKLLDFHRYIFRAPAPETPAKIKAYLRAELVRYMEANGVKSERQRAFLIKFDQTTDLVTESRARADGAIPDLPKVPASLLMPTQPKRRDDDQATQLPSTIP